MTGRQLFSFFLVVLIWGGTWIVIRDQVADVHPGWSTTYRFVVGGATMLLWCRWKGKPLTLPRDTWAFVATFGLLQFAINYNLVYTAQQYVPSAIPAVAYALLIVPNAILARIFLGHPLTIRFLVGSAIGIAGIALLFSGELSAPDAGAHTLLGIVLIVAGMLCTSVANVMQATKRAYSVPPLASLGWALLLSAGVSAVFALAMTGAPQWEARPEYALGLLYLGALGSGLSFAIYFELVRAIGPARAAWSVVLVPVVALFLSTMFEGFAWTGAAISGTLLALVGLIIALVPARKRG